MFCVNCFYNKTSVTNSRAHSKRPSVWRRRSCLKCNTSFTTYERPSLADNIPVSAGPNTTDLFNLGRLIVSISAAFQHDEMVAKYHSLWLAQTVEDTLSTQNKDITPEDIAATTHQMLKQFDELAAVQYAAQHQLITSLKKRPGRPSLVVPAQPKRQ